MCQLRPRGSHLAVSNGALGGLGGLKWGSSKGSLHSKVTQCVTFHTHIKFLPQIQALTDPIVVMFRMAA